MDPIEASSNAGTSINFDAQAHYDAEEAEYHREEQERQVQLHALIGDELEELSDEDDDSDGSRNVSRFSHDVSRDVSVIQPGLQDDAQSADSDLGQSENDLLRSGNVFVNPQGQWHHLTGGEAMIPAHPLAANDLIQDQVPPIPHFPSTVPLSADPRQGLYSKTDQESETVPLPYHHGHQHMGYGPSQYVNHGHAAWPSHGQASAADDIDPRGGGDYHGPPIYSGENNGPILIAEEQVLGERGEIEGANDDDGNYGNVPYHSPYQYVPQQPEPYQQSPQQMYPHNPMFNMYTNNQRQLPQNIYSPKEMKDNSDVKVSYQGPRSGEDNQTQLEQEITSSRRDEYEEMQDLYLRQDGGNDQRQLAQLQILYRARGRKIEELSESLSTAKEESEREVRILKHRMSIIQDEHSGMSSSLSQCQTLLAESKQREGALNGQVTALQTEIGALKNSKEDLVKKLQTAESTIESLNVQIQDLGSSECLQRAKEQHDSLVASMKQKYDAEIYELKEKLDQSNRGLADKNEGIQNLKRQLSDQIKAGENNHIERADTINRLTRSLEESQRQCQELLEAGTGQELSRMKLSLQEVIAGKSIAEDMNNALQVEIQDLKEQVMMYESASQFGILPGLSTASASHTTKQATNDLDDSYAQLGIKPPQPQFETPESARSDGSTPSTDTALHGLKAELERCLGMYKVKRQQVTTLQEELRTMKNDFTDTTQKYETLQKDHERDSKRLHKLESELGDMTGLGPREMKLQHDVDKLRRDNEALVLQVEDLKVRVQELAISEERLNEINCDLNQQMADMVKEYDEDKKIALDKCQEACLQHMDGTKEAVRQETLAAAEHSKSALIEEYEVALKKLRDELSEAQTELDDVKASYVNICKEKDDIQEELDKQWNDKLEKELAKLEAEMEAEKFNAIEQLKESLTTTNNTNITLAKDKWAKEQEEEVKRKIEAEVAQSKVEWFESHQSNKEQAVQAALRTKEAEWKHKYETTLDEELQHRLTQAKDKWKTERRLDTEKELQTRLMKAKETWRATEIDEAVSKALLERKNISEDRPSENEDFEKRLEAAKETWRKTELTEEIEKLKNEFKVNNKLESPDKTNARTTPIQEQINVLQQEMEDIGKEKERMENELITMSEQWAEEKATLEAKWKNEKAELIRQKDADKRKSLTEVRDQCEKDYRQFLQEHQDTLNKALRSAREQFALEKAEIIRKCEEEIAYHKNRDRRDTPDGKDNSVMSSDAKQTAPTNDSKPGNNGESSSVIQTESLVEQKCKEKIANIEAAFEQEKAELCQSHRDNLRKALEEAKVRWKQKSAKPASDAQPSQQSEQAWSQERETLLAQISERDQLLMAADTHMEAEIAKLQKELGVSQQAQLEQRVNNLESELSNKLNSSSSEKEGLITRMEEMQAELLELQARLNTDTQKLRDELKEKDTRIASLKKQVKESNSTVGTLQKQLKEVIENAQEVANQHAELTAQYDEVAKQLEKAEQTRQDMVDMYKKAEKEHAEIIESHKQRQNTLNNKVRRAEDTSKSLQTKMQTQLKEMQESLDREHSVAIDALKSKMVDLRNSHLVTIENLRKQHNAESEKLRRKLEQAERTRSNTPTQTEVDVIDQTAIAELKEQYVKAVQQMRGDVMNHVSQSNLRAAESVRTEVVKERQKTARRLRRYYLKCIDQLLEKDYDEESRAAKLAAVEQFLDNIPEKDSTGSRTTTPGLSTGGKTPTPEELVTPRNEENGNEYQIQDSGSRARQQEVTPRSIDIANYRTSEEVLHSGRSSRCKSSASDIGWESPRQRGSRTPKIAAAEPSQRRTNHSRLNKHSTPQTTATNVRSALADPQYSGSSIGSTSSRPQQKKSVYLVTPRDGSPVTTPELTPTGIEIRRSGSVTPTPDTPGYLSDINQSLHNDLSNSLYYNSSVNESHPPDISLELSTNPAQNDTYTKSPTHPHITGRTPSRSSLAAKDDTDLYVNSLNDKPVSVRFRDHSLDAAPRYRGQGDLSTQAHLCRSEDVLDTNHRQDTGYKYTPLRQRLSSLEAPHSARSTAEDRPFTGDLSSMVSMPNLNFRPDEPEPVFRDRQERFATGPKSAFSSTGYSGSSSSKRSSCSSRNARIGAAASHSNLAPVEDRSFRQSTESLDGGKRISSGSRTHSRQSYTRSAETSANTSSRSAGRTDTSYHTDRSSSSGNSAQTSKSDGISRYEVHLKIEPPVRSQANTLHVRRKGTPGMAMSNSQVFRPVAGSGGGANGSPASKHLPPREDSTDPSVHKPIPMVTRTTQAPSPAGMTRRKPTRYGKQ